MEHRRYFKTLATLAAALVLTAVGAAMPASSADTPKVNKLIIKRNYKAAVAVLTAQANAGDAVAQYRLGTLYRLGLGAPRDKAAAFDWFARSAEAGNAGAALVLKRLAMKPPTTPKKAGNLNSMSQPAAGTSIAFDKLPSRPAGQPDWLMLASARNQDSALKMMLENIKSTGLNRKKAAAAQIAARTSSVEALAALIAADSDLSQADARGLTPLMLAVESGNFSSVGAVLRGKPNLLQVDQSGNTAMALAARNCQPNIMHMLLEAGADFSSGGSMDSPLVSTVRYCADWLPFVRFLPAMDGNATDRQGRSAAWYAAANGNLLALEKLSAAGANLGLQDKEGFTPLHAAAVNGQQDIVVYIISHGSPASPVSMDGTTPLMLAAYTGCLECVQQLLAKTKEMNEKNSHGDTALMYAVRGGHGDLAKLLIDGGANADARNANDDTARKLAKRLKLPELQMLQ